MSIISETMKKWADENEITLNEVQLEKFENYARLFKTEMFCFKILYEY